MGKKRFYIEKEETITTTKKLKGYVVMESDYSQIYHNIFRYACTLDDRWALKYLLWLLPHANKYGMISQSEGLMEEFINSLKEFGSKSIPAIGSIRNSVTKLVQSNILIKNGKNYYQLNPTIIWGEDIKERIKAVEYLTENDKNLLPPNFIITENTEIKSIK